MNVETIRAFIAAELPAGSIDFIQRIIQEKKPDFPALRWVQPAQVHITLRFFGDLLNDRLPEVRHALAVAGESRSPFLVHLSGLGVFPTSGRARVLWLGINPAGAENLRSMVNRLETDLEAAGFERENRPYRAHVTLGRFRNPQLVRPVQLELNGNHSGEIKRLVLYQSTLTPQGPVYQELADSYLGSTRL